MGKPKKKKPKAPEIEWKSILLSGAIDFLVGLLLFIAERLIK